MSRVKRILAAVVLLVAAAGAAAIVHRAQAGLESSDRVVRMRGKAVPGSLFRDAGGGWVDLSGATSGAASLIAFIRPGCSRCESARRALGNLAELHPEWKVVVIEVLGGSGDAAREGSLTSVLTLRDERGEFDRVFGGTGVPMLVLVGPGGKVERTIVGEQTATQMELQMTRIASRSD